jgi:hypothetical protein
MTLDAYGPPCHHGPVTDDSQIISAADPVLDRRQHSGFVLIFCGLMALACVVGAMWAAATGEPILAAALVFAAAFFALMAWIMSVTLKNARRERIVIDLETLEVTFEYVNGPWPWSFLPARSFPISSVRKIRDAVFNVTVYFDATATSPGAAVSFNAVAHAGMLHTLAAASGVTPYRPWWSKRWGYALILALMLVGIPIMVIATLIIGILVWMPRQTP